MTHSGHLKLHFVVNDATLVKMDGLAVVGWAVLQLPLVITNCLLLFQLSYIDVELHS